MCYTLSVLNLFNLHPAVVHFPIALLLLASAAGCLYLVALQRTELRILTWWPMLLGWLGGIAAVLTGLLAQSGLPPAAPYRGVLNWHIGTGLAVLLVYGWLLYRGWLYGTARARHRRAQAGRNSVDLLDDPANRWWVLALLAVGACLVVASGWNGGRLVYEWAVNVAVP